LFGLDFGSRCLLFCHSDLKMVEKIIKNINILLISESRCLKTMKLGVLRIDDIFASLKKKLLKKALLAHIRIRYRIVFQIVKW
jgi:hypothetical protein